jgi:hypothetical protein
MHKLEKKLIENAIYSPDEYRETNIKKLLKDIDLTPSLEYMGQLSRVYKVKKTNWMAKEARWDFSMELVAGKHMPLPSRAFSWVLNKFSFAFLPDKNEILNQYKLYLRFAQYLGYFSSDDVYYHRNRDLIFLSQKHIRDSLEFYKEKIEKFYDFKIDPKIDLILQNTKIKYHNFLPKEYLLAGESISPENKGKVTSMIFQEFIQGKVLRAVPKKELTKLQKEQLILMIYLILLMNMEAHILPDTRPRYHFFEAYDWLTKTDNIIANKNGLKFIDTRWFWHTNDNLIKRGVFISKLIKRRAKKAINELLKEYE